MTPAQGTLIASIITQLVYGTAPWIRSRSTSSISNMPNYLATHRALNGANALQLLIAQIASGYATAEEHF
ncbi:MAG: hypothetical protein NVSMB64_27660 [Candidatus Velthaea sp.]